MEGYKHFSHPHNLSFHHSLEAAQLTCAGCKFPCTDTPMYSCRPCNFFLHQQCFDVTRTLIHPLHPNHPLSLFPSPTHASGSFICDLCKQTGSGFCFSCPTCDFDLHVHCAYNELKPITPPPANIKIKAHINHMLRYALRSPSDSDTGPSCDICGTECDTDSPLYRCDICDYDAHVECVSLPEIVQREDHAHDLSLLHVNPYDYDVECDVCRETIFQTNCMYFCSSDCDYGIHVTCVSEEAVSEKTPPMNDMTFQLEMFKLQNKMRVHKMMLDITTSGFRNRY